MSQFRPRTKIAAVVCLAGVLPWLVSVTSHLVLGDARLVQEPLHEGFELAGSCVALGVAMLLLLRLRRGTASSHLRCVAAALVGMGIIDGVHSLVPFDVASSWSRHIAALLGGTTFALVWLPPPAVSRRCRLLFPTLAAVALALAAAIWWWPERLPTPWVAGEYSGWVIASDALGGVGFLTAAAFFAGRYLREPKTEDLVFASYTLLFGTAGLFDGFSHVWAADWWVWHGARLLAYAVVLGAAYDVVGSLYEHMGRHTRELERRVHQRTAELATANLALREAQTLLLEAERLGKVGGWAFEIGTGRQTWTEGVRAIHEVDSTYQPTVEDGINFYTPGSRPVMSQAMQRAIEHGDAFDLELEIITAKGNLRSVHAIGRADPARRTVSGFFQDITEQKHVEEALRQSEQRFRQLSESLPQLIWTCQGDGQCDYLSPQWVTYTGIPEVEQLGFGWLGQVYLDDRDRTVVAWQAAVDMDTPVDVECRIRRHDGIYRWFKTRAIALRDDEGRVVKWFGSSTDIEDRRQAETAVRRLNAELDQRVQDRTAELEAANRELEAFSYSVSHDLRAPLRAIDGYSRILVEDYDDCLDPEGRRVLGVISSETRRMGQLIDDLLAFSRLGRQPMASSTIDMAALAQAIFAGQAAQAPERNLLLELKPMPTVRGDRAMISVVLDNLISNAIKFTASRHPGVVEIGGRREGGQTVYWVKDNGVGFDMSYAHKLFGVFQRLHSRGEFDGTGVGLALAQRVIHRHGGRIWADGIVDGGAVFSFSLPDWEAQHQ